MLGTENRAETMTAVVPAVMESGGGAKTTLCLIPMVINCPINKGRNPRAVVPPGGISESFHGVR